MRMLIAAALLAACATPAAANPTLDVIEFEPPFGAVPVAQPFIARHHITRISAHEVDPVHPTKVLGVDVLDYDARAALVRHAATDPDHRDQLREIATARVTKTDARGRAIERQLRGSTSAIVETMTYDAAGYLTRTVRTEREDKTDEVDVDEELRSYDTAGHLIRVTRGKLQQPPFETRELTYDAAGRIAQLHSGKPGFDDDRYELTYDAAGQLAQLRFVESGDPVYVRTFTYDADGFLTAVDIKSFVRAMGSERLVMTYERAKP